MSDFDAMFELARLARTRAYVPYSRFAVGACVRSTGGRLFAGCNVENASYPEGLCAESAAIANMIGAGERRISEVVVLAEGEALCTPCGGCRQRLAEFADPDTPVHLCGPDGLRLTVSLGGLLPFAFGQSGVTPPSDPEDVPPDDPAAQPA